MCNLTPEESHFHNDASVSKNLGQESDCHVKLTVADGTLNVVDASRSKVNETEFSRYHLFA